MSLLFSSIVIQTTYPILEAGRRATELQEGGECFQGGEKGHGVKHPSKFSQGERRDLHLSRSDQRMMNEGPQRTG